MKQGVLPFQYREERSTTGMTGLPGTDDLRGVDTGSGIEDIGGATGGSAGEWAGLDGQPDDHPVDNAEPSGW